MSDLARVLTLMSGGAPVPLNNLAAECHRLAVARGKYDKPWPWTNGARDIASELAEWVEAVTHEQVFGHMIQGRGEQEYGDILHTVLSIGAHMGYDAEQALADAIERNRRRAEEGV